MPFVSKRQERKCFAMKNKHQNGSWDCSEWAHSTDQKSLPEKKGYFELDKALLKLAKAAITGDK